MSNRGSTRGGWWRRGLEPYVRLLGLLLVLLALLLVFGVVVVDLVFVVSGTIGVVGALLAAFPSVVVSVLPTLS